MDITRGSLDDISRPASNERSRPGSRVSTVSLPEVGRVFHPSPTSLVVLSDDAPNNKQVMYLHAHFVCVEQDDLTYAPQEVKGQVKKTHLE